MLTKETSRRRTYADKLVDSNERLGRIIAGLKDANHRIVVTIGTWDLLHEGHLRYLIAAKEYGDILVVGVDSDRVVQLIKGQERPYKAQAIRCEMLSYQAVVDFIVLIDDVELIEQSSGDRHPNGRWRYGLLRATNPNIFIAEESSYPDDQLREIGLFCDQLISLKRQAPETSTSQLAKILKAEKPKARRK